MKLGTPSIVDGIDKLIERGALDMGAEQFASDMQQVFNWAATADTSGALLKDLRRLSKKILELDGEYYNDPSGKTWTRICRDFGSK